MRSSNNTSRCLMETMCRSSGKCPRAPCARGLMSWCGTISGAARRTTGSRAFACFLTPPRFSRIPQRSSHAPRREKLFKEAFCNTFLQRQTLAINVFDFPLKLIEPSLACAHWRIGSVSLLHVEGQVARRGTRSAGGCRKNRIAAAESRSSVSCHGARAGTAAARCGPWMCTFFSGTGLPGYTSSGGPWRLMQ